MKCIFCKKDASTSKSVEHIVPESLGNKSNILHKGIVCDICNNYFARKIEKKVLETEYFKSLRSRNVIESKKGRVPRGKAIIPKTKYQAEVIIKKRKPNEVIIDPESFKLIKTGKINHLIIPYETNFPKDNQFVSRFLAKVGLEMLALRILEKFPEDQNKFAEEHQLDPIRNYVRYNSKNENWVYSSRKIYEEHEKFYLEDGTSVDMVFECDFLTTKETEIYFVIAIKGIEFAINMAGASIDGYKKWLDENNQISPLYREGMNFGYKLTPEFVKNKKTTHNKSKNANKP